jgi:ElaB/YqjD/DUF883 family membrane-anchored ribosome-binding protein
MKNTSPGKASDKVISDFRTLASHAQELLAATATYSGDGVNQAREKLMDSLKDVTEQMKEYQDYAFDQTKKAAEAADTFVHDRPWQSIAAAFLAGLFVGAISGGRR